MQQKHVKNSTIIIILWKKSKYGSLISIAKNIPIAVNKEGTSFTRDKDSHHWNFKTNVFGCLKKGFDSWPEASKLQELKRAHYEA